MKKLRILGGAAVALGVLALTGGLGSASEQNAGPNSLVTVCHRAGPSNVIVLTIPQQALAAHLAHGDNYPIPGTTMCEGVEPPPGE